MFKLLKYRDLYLKESFQNKLNFTPVKLGYNEFHRIRAMCFLLSGHERLLSLFPVVTNRRSVIRYTPVCLLQPIK
jgi:hypothetical protein